MARLSDILRARRAAAFERLRLWGFSLTPRGRWHISALVLRAVGSVAHFLVFAVYYIEDAGISFAYARNFAEGEGWVAWAGGERVEGFSNPLWTWLVAAFYLVGVPPWTSSKLMGAVFGAACIPMSYLLSRACRPGRDDNLDLLAPFFLAASSTAAIWHASGLENGLFSVLLTGGMLLVLREGQQPQRHPLSALCFLGLALTRPEGILYAAMAGLVILREPIISLLFERGAFNAESVRLTAGALLYYGLGLWAFTSVRIVVSTFYALPDAGTPVRIALVL